MNKGSGREVESCKGSVQNEGGRKDEIFGQPPKNLENHLKLDMR